MPAHDTARNAPPTGFIAEINGMRGLALVLVVGFHLFGAGRVSGGVDVFLVLSAFLLTRSLLREHESGSLSPLAARYTRTFARIAPPALTVLVAVGAMTVTLLPSSQWRSNFAEIAASALYVENYQLISSQLSYGAAGPTASPLQHFWSLSIQGQFFLIWPVVFLAVATVGRRLLGTAGRALLIATTGILTTASFTYAIVLVQIDQPVAYFSSLTRFWELGVGALAAMLLRLNCTPERARPYLGWAGCLLVVSSGFLINGIQVYPGPWTLVPVVGILLVLVGSGTSAQFGLDRALNVRPLRFIADISYHLYLWHWPVLVAYLAFREYEKVGWKGGLVVLLVSIGLAVGTRHVLSRPSTALRDAWPVRRSLATMTALAFVVGLGGFSTATALAAQQRQELATLARPSADHPGAAVLLGDASGDAFGVSGEFRPSVATAEKDLPSIYGQGCIQNWRSGPGLDEVLVCEDLRADGDEHATVVMSGGSHTQQWYDAVRLVADQSGWRLVVVEKDGCRLKEPRPDPAPEASCERWNQRALDVILDASPDAVITVGTATPPEAGPVEVVLDRQVAVWERLEDEGVPVAAIRDTPRFDFRVPECVSTRGPAACTAPRQEIFQEVSPLASHRGLPSTLVPLDLTDAICGPTTCEPIVGNVLAYRDDDHLTATYTRTIAAELRRQIETTMPQLFR